MDIAEEGHNIILQENGTSRWFTFVSWISEDQSPMVLAFVSETAACKLGFVRITARYKDTEFVSLARVAGIGIPRKSAAHRVETTFWV